MRQGIYIACITPHNVCDLTLKCCRDREILIKIACIAAVIWKRHAIEWVTTTWRIYLNITNICLSHPELGPFARALHSISRCFILCNWMNVINLPFDMNLFASRRLAIPPAFASAKVTAHSSPGYRVLSNQHILAPWTSATRLPPRMHPSELKIEIANWMWSKWKKKKFLLFRDFRTDYCLAFLLCFPLRQLLEAAAGAVISVGRPTT